MFAIVTLALISQADAGVSAHPLEGEWKLDLEQSSDTGPVLEKLGASWFVRQAAKSARPTHRLRVNQNTVFLEIEGAGGKKRVQLVLDGTTPTKDEFFSQPFQYTTQLDRGAFVSKGVLEKDGLNVSMRRELRADGLMLYRITLEPKGEPPLVIDRVFRRTK